MLMNHSAGKLCLLELADVLDRLCTPFFLMQGTALGAWRDGGFVPSEKDIDLGVLQENLAPISHKLISGLMSRGFDVECFTMPFNVPRTIVGFKSYDGHSVKVDIVGMARWKNWRFTATPVRSWIDKPYALVHDAALIENYEPFTLFGRTFYLPSPIETYLEREYGPKWSVPQDDHVSRTRIYDFLNKEGIPSDYLG